MRTIYAYLIAVLTLSSCFKEEEPVEPYPRGISQENLLKLGENYEQQLYLDLGTNTVVKANSRFAWDLAFSCDPQQAYVTLNSGRNMRAGLTNATEVGDLIDTAGLEMRWDWSNGKPDSMAMFDWTEGKVYLVDLGLDNEFEPLGFVKVKVEKRSDSWHLEYADLGSVDADSADLLTNEEYNHVHYSVLNDSTVDIEPKKSEYDLWFTQYVFYFEEEDFPYLVLGTLLNPFQTEAYREFDLEYDVIERDMLEESSFSTVADVIGYDWKYFSFGEGTYVVFDDQIYLLRDSEGFIYKFKFTGFYNSSGDKGYPTISFEQL